MDEAQTVPPPVVPAPMPPALVWVRRVVCLSMAALGVSVIWELGGRLVGELSKLSADWTEARDREPVGYKGISAEQPEHKPPSCIREEDGRVWLWAGSGAKGQAGWFDATATDLPLRHFMYAFGRDKVKTIDYPIFQAPDGEIARRIYPERPVFGLNIDRTARAYPRTVMEKVEVVNDTVGNRAIAVAYCPLVKKPAVYERTLDGVVLSFGTSGYCYEGVHVLYDRATDSLWLPQSDGLKAITGTHAGKLLPLTDEQLDDTTWGQWQRRHSATEVLVGGDRSRGIPLPEAVASRTL